MIILVQPAKSCKSVVHHLAFYPTRDPEAYSQGVNCHTLAEFQYQFLFLRVDRPIQYIIQMVTFQILNREIYCKPGS